LNKKFNVILTRKGEIHIKPFTHCTIINKYKIRGDDWHDWIRATITQKNDKQWTVQIKAPEYPEWIERQHTHWKNKILDEAKKLGMIK
jgi:hypothetical protein